MKTKCPSCDYIIKGKKSRKDEYFVEEGIVQKYIYCCWCDVLLVYEADNKIQWDLWANFEKGLKYD